jgi:cytochrome c oxidase cbb3-type subunit 3
MKKLINGITVLLLIFVSTLIYVVAWNPELINVHSGEYSAWFTFASIAAMLFCLLYLVVLLYQKAKIFLQGENPDSDDNVSRRALASGFKSLLRVGSGTILVILSVGMAAASFVPHFGDEVKSAFTGNLILFSILGLVVALFIFALAVKSWWNRMDPKKIAERQKEREMFLKYTQETGITVEKRSFWEKILQIKPMYTDRNATMGHSYDGIQELDNPPPPWFMFLFYGTILFAVIYFMYYMVLGIGMTQEEEYAMEVKQAEIAKAEYLLTAAEDVDESNVLVLEEANFIQEGSDIYGVKCSACHGANGEGGIGPNLTDEYWVNGGGIVNVFKTIKYGVPAKGMKSWQDELSPSKIQKVASYILTLKGSNPENAKDPQGELWTDVVEPDSTATDTAQDLIEEQNLFKISEDGQQ